MNYEGINKLASIMQNRMQLSSKQSIVLDFGTIQNNYDLLLDSFPIPIPVSDYMICRQLSYNPKEPLTMTVWQQEGGRGGQTLDDWNEGKKATKGPDIDGWKYEDWTERAWNGREDEKELHKPPDTIPDHGHSKKGEHDHSKDADGKHYHDVYLPLKMDCLKPKDRVLVAWVMSPEGGDVGANAVVIDKVLPAETVVKYGYGN